MIEPVFTITIYDRTVDSYALKEALDVYQEVYAEPPYCESEGDVFAFSEDLPRRAAQPNFRLAVARLDDEPLGFAMGHELLPTTSWWAGASPDLPIGETLERPGRTFALIELAVRRHYRRMNFATRLHSHITAGLSEERVTLLVRPDAVPAQAFYTEHSYRWIGKLRPYPGAPMYDSMVLE